VAGLHRRASDWYEQHGLAADAMSHALAALDLERIIRLTKQKAAVMLSRSELVTVLGWLDALPQELARSPSRFPLVQAWAMALTGQLSAVETHLEEAERLVRANHPEPLEVTEADMIGEIFTLRATVAYFQRDMLQAQTLYREALNQLPPDNLYLRGIVMGGFGAACSWSGDVTAATQAFTEATAISLSSHNLPVALIALWNWAQLQVEQGYLRQAYDLYQRALQLVDEQAEDSRKTLLAQAGRIHLGLAELMYQWNELEDAASYVQQGLKLAEQEQESAVLAGGYLVWARLKQAQGDQVGAQEAVQRAGVFAQRYTGPRYLAAQVQIYQVHLWLQQANLRLAAAWIQEEALQLDPLPDPIPYLREGEYMVLARLLLLRYQQQNDDTLPPVDNPLATALNVLDRIIEAARAKSRMGRVIEARTVQARLLLANNQQNQALLALEDALTLAEPAGYVRCFVDEGPSIAGLLRQMRASGVEPAYAGQLLAAFQGVKHTGQAFGRLAAQDSQFLLDPLSQRELEILRLIATGMSNRDLAETLVVTVGTVKWHLNNIYSKLAVRSRTQAVARARELGLL
jgi:LuxR family maltose regulon positive regulatory protein